MRDRISQLTAILAVACLTGCGAYVEGEVMNVASPSGDARVVVEVRQGGRPDQTYLVRMQGPHGATNLMTVSRMVSVKWENPHQATVLSVPAPWGSDTNVYRTVFDTAGKVIKSEKTGVLYTDTRSPQP